MSKPGIYTSMYVLMCTQKKTHYVNTLKDRQLKIIHIHLLVGKQFLLNVQCSFNYTDLHLRTCGHLLSVNKVRCCYERVRVLCSVRYGKLPHFSTQSFSRTVHP